MDQLKYLGVLAASVLLSVLKLTNASWVEYNVVKEDVLIWQGFV